MAKEVKVSSFLINFTKKTPVNGKTAHTHGLGDFVLLRCEYHPKQSRFNATPNEIPQVILGKMKAHYPTMPM